MILNGAFCRRDSPKNAPELIRRGYSVPQIRARPLARVRQIMESFKAYFFLVVLGSLCTPNAFAQGRLGAQGAEWDLSPLLPVE